MRHPPYVFDIYLFSKRQNHKEDGANFCGLLRKAELYQFLILLPGPHFVVALISMVNFWSKKYFLTMKGLDTVESLSVEVRGSKVSKSVTKSRALEYKYC